MQFLKRLFRTPRFTRFDDAYAMTPQGLWRSLCQAIELQRSAGYQLWLVTHFPQTFFNLQERLADEKLDYAIIDQRISPHDAFDRVKLEEKPIQLVLAELLTPAATQTPEMDADAKVAMIVLERHPLFGHDDELESFARSIPCVVRFGYFLSFEDTVLIRALPENVFEILKLLGMNEHELIASSMVNRRMEKALRKHARMFDTDHAAESANEWYRINEPTS